MLISIQCQRLMICLQCLEVDKGFPSYTCLTHTSKSYLTMNPGSIYMTINTHKEFQQKMEKILQGLTGVTVYFVDILITGANALRGT